MIWMIRIAGTAAITLTLVPLWRTGFWAVRCWDFPRVQLACVLGVLIAFSIWSWVTQGHSRESTAWCLVLGGACLWQLSHVLPFTPAWPPELTDDGRAAPTLTVCIANLKYDSDRVEEAVGELTDFDCDVLVLVEMDRRWRKAFEPLEDEYPYRHEAIRENGLGLAVWSRYSLQQAETRFLIEDRRPSIWATIDIDGGSANLVALHPTPPGLDDRTGDDRRDSRIRDAELVRVARVIADRSNENWIVAGDLNDVAWSHTTRLFKRLSGMKDPRVGRGLMNTYHAKSRLVQFPIDHVFLSPGFRVHSITRRRVPGSDHYALLSKVRLARPDAEIDPDVDAHDRAEAKQIVDQGENDAEERGVEASP